jgi:O-acetyl-ADP-ribose deacetylase (regulator of RNase III)
MHLILFDINENVIEAFKSISGTINTTVSVHHGGFTDLEADAIVSPANSFGYMNGGIDLAYRNFFGNDIERRVRSKIMELFGGELPVGSATAVSTNHGKLSNLIVSPTMLIPMDISNSRNVYLAASAAFLYAKYNSYHTIAMPGMGTGVGRVSPSSCAEQIQAAINEVL